MHRSWKCVRSGAAALASALAMLALTGCGAGSARLLQDNDRFADCSGPPRCVSSQAEDQDRYIAPLRYAGSAREAREQLLAHIDAQPGTEIVTGSSCYVHATYTTTLMRYVDDVELLFCRRTGFVDVRSSSRIGYYDFGTNRARVETLRAVLTPDVNRPLQQAPDDAR